MAKHRVRSAFAGGVVRFLRVVLARVLERSSAADAEAGGGRSRGAAPPHRDRAQVGGVSARRPRCVERAAGARGRGGSLGPSCGRAEPERRGAVHPRGAGAAGRLQRGRRAAREGRFLTAPPKNALVVTPAVPGSLAWADERTLEFRATRPFDPAVTYTVRVEGLAVVVLRGRSSSARGRRSSMPSRGSRSRARSSTTSPRPAHPASSRSTRPRARCSGSRRSSPSSSTNPSISARRNRSCASSATTATSRSASHTRRGRAFRA